jgi:adenylate kinase
MSEIIVLMGAPGAGKGTQARFIQEQRGIPQISTGDMFRSMKDAQTPLAEEVRGIMNTGKLVPDDLTIRVVRERTNSEDCLPGYILDGFPRTTAQAEMLEDLAAEQKKNIHAVSIDVPLDILEQRVTGRRSCPVCGEIYNVYFKPPKDDNVCDLHPDTQLAHRSDDTPEKIKVRLATYEQQTQPLLDYYERTGRLCRIDGTREPEVIYADIDKILSSLA